jgi:hypothetical protein
MASESQEVIRKFRKRLTVSVGYYQEMLLAVHLKTHQASLETMLAEQFTFNCAVLWEVFLSDLLLAYVVMNPASYLKGLKANVSRSLKDRYGGEVEKCAELTFPSKITRVQAKALVDPKQFNISIQSSAVLTKKANELLAATHAKKFTLTKDDAQLVDFVIAVRNYLGHRSKAARAAIKSTQAQLGGANIGLRGDTRDMGTYLKRRNADGDTRAIVIAQRLAEVASHLQH